ncbi:hypothetical protein, partial [Bacillus cereus]|uniref:hypothetical protein n=1 Tax=Bacillus cereus TaxID=1396 RepID=UPI0020BFF8C2
GLNDGCISTSLPLGNIIFFGDSSFHRMARYASFLIRIVIEERKRFLVAFIGLSIEDNFTTTYTNNTRF